MSDTGALGVPSLPQPPIGHAPLPAQRGHRGRDGVPGDHRGGEGGREQQGEEEGAAHGGGLLREKRELARRFLLLAATFSHVAPGHLMNKLE